MKHKTRKRYESRTDDEPSVLDFLRNGEKMIKNRPITQYNHSVFSVVDTEGEGVSVSSISIE